MQRIPRGTMVRVKPDSVSGLSESGVYEVLAQRDFDGWCIVTNEELQSNGRGFPVGEYWCGEYIGENTLVYGVSQEHLILTEEMKGICWECKNLCRKNNTEECIFYEGK